MSYEDVIDVNDRSTPPDNPWITIAHKKKKQHLKNHQHPNHHAEISAPLTTTTTTQQKCTAINTDIDINSFHQIMGYINQNYLQATARHYGITLYWYTKTMYTLCYC
jgi:hypothetical protein